jgi:hypothetical protein
LKKISSIRQLEIRKNQLENKRDALQIEIQINWYEINQLLTPKSLLKSFILKDFKNIPF